MTESEFIALADRALERIGEALDAALDASDADVDWSLNDDGKYLKQRHPGSTPRELMDYGVAFSKDGPAKIWSFGAILASGVSMILVFLFTFVLWVFGWSMLAKRKALGPP